MSSLSFLTVVCGLQSKLSAPPSSGPLPLPTDQPGSPFRTSRTLRWLCAGRGGVFQQEVPKKVGEHQNLCILMGPLVQHLHVNRQPAVRDKEGW